MREKSFIDGYRKGEDMSVQELAKKIQQETEKIIIGKSEKIRLVIMAVLAEGHVLLNDLPGVGKTTLVKTSAFP